jgi:hypothetical protein
MHYKAVSLGMEKWKHTSVGLNFAGKMFRSIAQNFNCVLFVVDDVLK